VKEEHIHQSEVQVNNLVAETGENKRRRREKADINYHNYYIRLNEGVVRDTARLGFPDEFIRKCLSDNANNHCTTTYYLLCMD
jgi:hypothetical protein